MCSAWAIMRPRSSKSAVEQSRRSLMLAEKAERMSTAPISSAIERSGCREPELDIHAVVTFPSRFRRHQRAISIPIPTHPGATSTLRPRARAWPDSTTWSGSRCAEVELRARRGLRRSDGDELELSSSICVAVSVFVRAVECFREVVLDRHRQLEGLTRVAQIGFALGGQVCLLGERPHVRHDLVAPLVARDEPQRREHACGSGHDTVDLELVGERRRHAAGPHRRTLRARTPRVVSALDRDHPDRAQHLGVHDLECRAGIDAVEGPGGRLSIELDAACEHGRQPAE